MPSVGRSTGGYRRCLYVRSLYPSGRWEYLTVRFVDFWLADWDRTDMPIMRIEIHIGKTAYPAPGHREDGLVRHSVTITAHPHVGPVHNWVAWVAYIKGRKPTAVPLDYWISGTILAAVHTSRLLSPHPEVGSRILEVLESGPGDEAFEVSL